MKALRAFYKKIEFQAHPLTLEFEEYQTLWHVHIIDRRRYFSWLYTFTFRKSDNLSTDEMTSIVYDHCLTKQYF